MQKILQSPDGHARLIDNTRELDEVFQDLTGQQSFNYAKIQLRIFEKGDKRTYTMNGKRCTVYPLGHPEAPEVTSC